jgi:hypothetical protein
MTAETRWVAALRHLIAATLRREDARDQPIPRVRVLTRDPNGKPLTWGPVMRTFGPEDWDDD